METASPERLTWYLDEEGSEMAGLFMPDSFVAMVSSLGISVSMASAAALRRSRLGPAGATEGSCADEATVAFGGGAGAAAALEVLACPCC